MIKNNINGFGNDSHTVILITAEETVSSYKFTESGINGHLCELIPDGSTYPAQNTTSKFDTYAYKYPSSSSPIYIKVGTGLHSDWTITDNDFTLDFWEYDSAAYITSGTQSGLLAGCYIDDDNYWGITYSIVGGSPATLTYHFISRSSAVTNIDINFTYNKSANIWNHFAVVKNGSNIKFYVDGELKASGTLSSIDTISSPFYVGAQDIDGSFDRELRLDEIRLSKGIARWNSEFTVPNRAY